MILLLAAICALGGLQDQLEGGSPREFLRIHGAADEALVAGRWEDAKAEFLRALRLSPNNATLAYGPAVRRRLLAERRRPGRLHRDGRTLVQRGPGYGLFDAETMTELYSRFELYRSDMLLLHGTGWFAGKVLRPTSVRFQRGLSRGVRSVPLDVRCFDPKRLRAAQAGVPLELARGAEATKKNADATRR